jgi:hypothetical protein
MKHRIITDGKKFRVETLVDSRWSIETKTPEGMTREYLRGFYSSKSARQFIREKYGTSAEIEPRTWRPI